MKRRRTKRTKEQDPNQLSLYGAPKDPSKEERSPAPARTASPAPKQKQDRSKYKDHNDFSKTTGIYFSHRRYPDLILEYIGPLFYMNGDKVQDFVSVRCMNDLGLRAYSSELIPLKRSACSHRTEESSPIHTIDQKQNQNQKRQLQTKGSTKQTSSQFEIATDDLGLVGLEQRSTKKDQKVLPKD